MALLVGLARLAAVTVAALVMFWALGFQTSFLPVATSADDDAASSTTQLDFIYSVLHPLLMVIGFILLTGEAILAHRTMGRWSRGTRKSAHLALQGAAFGFGVFGIWAKFQANDGVVSNFLSLHSWMGLLCLSLFASQWVVGFLSFWHRGEGRRARAAVLPWHVFLGLYTYGLAVATAETGLLEKLTFLQASRASASSSSSAARRSLESVLVNALGVGLALLCGVVVLAAVSPKGRRGGRKAAATPAKGSNGYDAVIPINNGDRSHGYRHPSSPMLMGEEEAGDGDWKLHN
uniref:Putative transmembrane ascorbate ferrireductase 4 n=1 Tax=Anthurium amnicola TaxID=1678845 RepID=A0A1D1Y330_9ARAE